LRRFSDPAGVTVARIWANYCFYGTAWDAHLADEISRRAGTLLENLALQPRRPGAILLKLRHDPAGAACIATPAFSLTAKAARHAKEHKAAGQ